MTVTEIIDLAKGHANVSSAITTHDDYLLNVFNGDIYVRVRNEIIRLRQGYFQAEYTQGIVADQVDYDVKNTGGTAVDWQTIDAVKVKLDASSTVWLPVYYNRGGVDESEPTESQGWTVPESYSIIGNQIRFDIYPSESVANALKITITPKPATYVGANTPEIPAEYHWVMAWGVAAALSERTGNAEGAARFWTRFHDGLQLLRVEMSNRSRQAVLIPSAPFADDY